MTEKTREATSTIRGYNYQFDSTILMLLKMRDDDSLTIEGVEDFDVTSKTEFKDYYQCKYYSSERLTSSTIRDAIMPMIMGFKRNDLPKNIERGYHLYGYFKDSTPQDKKLSIEELKECLKRREKNKDESSGKEKFVIIDLQAELNIADTELQVFSDRLNIHICHEYEMNIDLVSSELARIFKVSKEEATRLLYPTAFSIIANKATKKNITDRILKRREFLQSIKPSKVIISAWLENVYGEDRYCGFVRTQYFTHRNIEADERYFIFEFHSSESIEDIISVVDQIRKKWSSHSLTRKPNSERYAPFIFIRNISKEDLIAIKAKFMSESKEFVDGYSFHGAEFNVENLKKVQTLENRISIRFINSKEDLDAALNHGGKRRFVYEFINQLESLNYTDKAFVYSIKCHGCESIKSMI